MPLVKKSNGWFWGSKGPFATKAKALSVARAAHAHGFKESQEFPVNIKQIHSKSADEKKVAQIFDR